MRRNHSKSLIVSVLAGLSILAAPIAWACATHGKSDPKAYAKWKERYAKASSTKRSPASDDVPFGGKNSAKWAIESVLANAFDSELREARANPDVVDSVAAIPVNFEDSGFHPFGDGQSNARPNFGPHFKPQNNGHLPPMVARRDIFKNGSKRYSFKFHPEFNADPSKAQIVENGDVVFVKINGWNDWFVVSFDSWQLPVTKMLEGMPASAKNWSSGSKLPDPEGVAAKAMDQSKSAVAILGAKGFKNGYNAEPFISKNVHGLFPNENGARTAVGGSATWLVEPKQGAPFKHIYICFEGRNLSEEESAGVPSGAGWHHIGDAAETVVNSLESGDILAAVGHDLSKVATPGGGRAFNFQSSATARYVRHGDAFVTRRGQFHWYAIPSSASACTEIWVHGCEPSPANAWGFGGC